MTLSITGITPFLSSRSVIITCESFTNTFPSTTFTAIAEPCNLLSPLPSPRQMAITTIPNT